jgi:DNA-binding SARP family transcriptional activator
MAIVENLPSGFHLVEGSADPLRFAPPVPDPLLLPRPRLQSPLTAALSRRLTLLKAPAGFGKSALLTGLAAGFETRTLGNGPRLLAWYRLDPRDSDPAVLLEGLVASVRRVLPAFGRTVVAALQTTHDARADFSRLMALFTDDLRQSGVDRISIVLEDLHNLRDRSTFDVLEKCLLDDSSPLRLIVSTQTDPGFYLSVLRSAGSLMEIGEEDLRFTAVEIAGLLRLRLGRQPHPSLVDEILRQTGGWPSAVRLAVAIAAREGGTLPFRRLAPTLHGYARLLGEILSPLSPDDRDELLRSSSLCRVEPRSLEEAIGVRAPTRLMSLIEELELPTVRTAGQGAVMEYEPLLRLTMQQQLDEQVGGPGYAALQERVARYYAATGDPDEAIRRYVGAGAVEAAATVVEDFIEAELSRGHAELVLDWLRLLPNSVRQHHPALLIHEARLLLGRQRLNDARVLLVGAEPSVHRNDQRLRSLLSAGWAKARLLDARYPEALGSADEAIRLVAPEDWVALSQLHGLVGDARAAMGDLRGAFSAASRGLLAAERSGNQLLVVRAMLHLGQLAQLRGDYTQALALLGRSVHRSALVGTESVTIGAAAGVAAAIYLERGQRREAVRVASLARERGARFRDGAIQLRGGLATALALQQQGEVEVSASAMSRAQKLAASLPARAPERFLALQAEAAAMLRDGKREQGRAAARDALRVASSPSIRPLVEQCELMVAFDDMSSRRPSPSGILRLRRLCGSVRRTDSRRWLSGGLAFIAQGYDRLGLRWPAASNLRRALALAQEEGYVGAPLGLRLDGRGLLSLAVRVGVAHEVAGTLLGVEPEAGKRALAPLLSHKDPHLRTRAEQAIKGLESGAGRAREALLPWPGMPDGNDESGLTPERARRETPVEIVALGGFRTLVRGQAVEWPSADARDLAAYLLVNRSRRIHRDSLVSDLWPTSEPEEANLRLHVALYRLRESLGEGYPAVELGLEERGLYRWNGHPGHIDAVRFRSLLKRAAETGGGESAPLLNGEALGPLEEAVGLYQGEFLDGLGFQWSLALREELRGLLITATRLLVDHYMAARQWDSAVRHGLKSLKSDPLQEGVVRDLMVCYSRLGRRDVVMQQYREVKRLLARELGVWPSEETRQLRVRLLGR